MNIFQFGPNYTKLKMVLKLGCSRLQLLQEKKTEEAQKLKREIANYIITRKYAKAKIKTQQILRCESMVQAMEIMEMFCDQFLDRYSYFEGSRIPDKNLVQIISSLVWVTPYLQNEVTELKEITKQVSIKYGNRFIQSALKNKQKTVNCDLIQRVKFVESSESKIYKCLKEIAKKYQVPNEIMLDMEKYFSPVNGKSKSECKVRQRNPALFPKSVSTENLENNEIVEEQKINDKSLSLIESPKLKTNIDSSETDLKNDHVTVNVTENYTITDQPQEEFEQYENVSAICGENLYPSKKIYNPNAESQKLKMSIECKIENLTRCDSTDEIVDEPPPPYTAVVNLENPLPLIAKSADSVVLNDIDCCSIFPSCPQLSENASEEKNE